MATIDGSSSGDTINAGNGNDIINSGAGNDTVDGGNGNDVIDGGSGNDTLYGGNGTDTLSGGSGNDTLDGGNGDDILSGGSGDDSLSGGNGDDVLDGGSGSDSLSGGNGDDIFIYNVAENLTSTDNYDGGKGSDTLKIIFDESSLQYLTEHSPYQTTNAYIDALKQFFASKPVGSTIDFFSTFGFHLTITKIENMVLDVPVVTNHAPTALDSSVNGTEDTALTLAAANFGFSDPDSGDSLQAIKITQLASNGKLMLGNSEVLLNQEISLADLNASNLKFIPNENANGPTSLHFQVSDGHLWSGDATLSIAIAAVNDAPVAENSTVTISEDDQGISGQVIAHDAEDNALTYQLLTHTGGNTLIEQQLNGFVTFNADGSYSYVTGLLYQTLNEGEHLDYTFTYRATEQDADSLSSNDGTVTIRIEGHNDNPQVTNKTVLIDEDHTLSGQVAARDVDDTELTFSLVSGTNNGTLDFNSDNGSYIYTPNENYNGNDSFSYRVTDAHGGFTDVTQQITINPVNDAPVAEDSTVSISEDDQGISGQVIAHDAEDNALTYQLLTHTGGNTLIEQQLNGFVTFNADGSYSYVTGLLYQTLNEGEHLDYTFTYRATEQDADSPLSSNDGTVTIRIEGHNDNPNIVSRTAVTDEDQSLSGQLVAKDIDDTQITFSLLSGPINGTLVLNNDGSYVYTPAENYNGGDSFRYRVTDAHGGFTDATLQISVNPINDAPVITSSNAVSGDEDHVITGKISATDVEGDSLTYALVTGFGPAHGTLTLNSDGNFSYTPNANFNGSDTFKYSVDDGNGGHVERDMQITVNSVNDAPVITSPNIAVGFEDQLALITGQLTATDEENDPLTYVLSQNPAHGSVVIDSDRGFFSYRPDANFNGQDSFKYIVVDSHGDFSSEATMNVIVNAVNDAPVITSSNAVSGDEDSASISGKISATDVEGDSLTYALVAGFGPAHGTLTLNSDGNFSYTPNANFNGSDLFKYSVDDGNGGHVESVMQITVNSVNDAPVITSPNAVVGFEDQLALITGQLTATDAENDPLTYILSQNPAHGSVVIDSDRGFFSYRPDANFNGQDSFQYIVVDSHGDFSNEATMSVIVNAVNDAPVITSPNAISGDTNHVLTGQLSATDVDGDTLTYAPFTVPTHGTLALNPNGSFTYTPASGFHGQDSFTYTVYDGHDSVQGNMAITINETTLFTSGNDVVDFNALTTAQLTGDIYNALAGDDYVILPTHDRAVLLGNIFPHEFRDGLGSDTIMGQSDMNETITATSAAPNSTSVDNFNLLDGPADFDTVTYREVTSAVFITFQDFIIFEQQEVTGGAGHQFLMNVEGIEGTSFNDSIQGNSENNYLSGLDGDDGLYGMSGDDTLIGGGGHDTLDGGAGSDWVSYRDVPSPVFVNLAQGFALNDGQGSSDALANIENVIGSTLNDNITGDGNDNIIIGDLGDDILSGGDGNDSVSYQTATGFVVVDLNLQVNFIQNTQNAGWDQLFGFENIIGSNYDDVLIGDDGNNSLEGGRGNDELWGNMPQGLAGLDMASYRFAEEGVRVSLALQGDYQYTGDATGWDKLLRFEGLIGSRFDDRLTGDSNDNSFNGGDGDDRIDGGDGQDTAIYSDSDESVTVDLNWGHAIISNSYIDSPGSAIISSDDTLISIENVVGSTHRDFISGDMGANNLRGNAGDDTLQGLDGNDTLFGDEGNDILYGGTGNDILGGGAGNDNLNGNDGNDTFVTSWNSGQNFIDGGDGFDSLDYRSHISTFGQGVGIHADFITGTVTNNYGFTQFELGDEYFVDRFINIENIFGTKYDDTLIGNSNDNVFSYGDEEPNPLLFGDTIIGGGGNDTLSFSAKTVGVYFDFNTGSIGNLVLGNSYALIGSVALSAVEGVEGTSFRDILIGDAFDNNFYGNDGNDVIEGGDGNDIIEGGKGADELDGGAGLDLLSYKSSDVGITLSLAQPTIINSPLDNFSNFEGIEGSKYNDTLYGDSQNNVLLAVDGEDQIYGGAGDDTIDAGRGGVFYNLEYSNNRMYGEAGDDTIIAGSPNSADYIDGGSGTDTVSYRNALSSVTVYLEEANALQHFYQNTGGGGWDLLANVENLIGSNYNDALIGNSADNVLEGGNGNDTLDGGAGRDSASYLHAESAVTVRLFINGDQNTGGAGTDLLFNIENLIGSNYNDTFIGDNNNNVIDGGEGDDWLDGGNGIDTLSFNSATHGVNANLVEQDFGAGAVHQDTGLGNDVIINFENLTGSKFADELTGNDGVNVINGGNGDDIISGLGGNDTLYGDAGNDAIYGGDGNDYLIGGDGLDYLDGGSGLNFASYADSQHAVNIFLGNTQQFNEGDTYLNIQGIVGSNFDDVLTGNQFDNTLIGSLGSDILDGGQGQDTASYTDAQGTILADLSSGIISNNTGNGVFTDRVFNIENVTGSNQNDVFFGNAANNTFDGGLGDDILTLNNQLSKYSFAYDMSDNNLQITLRGTSQVDTVSNIEIFQFTDTTVDYNMLLSIAAFVP